MRKWKGYQFGNWKTTVLGKKERRSKMNERCWKKLGCNLVEMGGNLRGKLRGNLRESVKSKGV